MFGGLTGTANITLVNNGGGAIALSVGNNSSNSTCSGVLSDSGLGGSLTKVGNGTLTLSGANTYSGATTVSGGKLVLNTLQTNATAESPLSTLPPRMGAASAALAADGGAQPAAASAARP